MCNIGHSIHQRLLFHKFDTEGESLRGSIADIISDLSVEISSIKEHMAINSKDMYIF